MTETCDHRRSRLTTPLAMLLGAVLVSGTSAYAAATITGAQIRDNSVSSTDIANNSLTYADLRDGYVIGNDLQAETVTGAKIRNGSVAAADLAPGVANRFLSVRTTAGPSPRLGASTEDWQWALGAEDLQTYTVTTPTVFTANGVVGYVGGPSSQQFDVAVCVSVDGAAVRFAGESYGTVTLPTTTRVNAPVTAQRVATSGTLTFGPCVRGLYGGANALTQDNSAVTVMLTTP